MATFSKVSLSGSANYNLIRVDSASSPGVTIHTAVSGNAVENQADEVWLYAYNSSGADLTLTLEWAQAAACIVQSVPSKAGEYLIVAGRPISNAYLVRAYAGNASQIFLGGYVNQIRP